MATGFTDRSVGRELTDDDVRELLRTGITGKSVSREALELARKSAELLAEQIDELERLPPAELLRRSDAIIGMYDVLKLSVLHIAPHGLPHEPQVLAWKEWQSTQLPGLMREWSDMLEAIPAKAFSRLEALVTDLPRLTVAQQALSENARKGATATRAANPAATAMDVIREEWRLLQVAGSRYPGDAAFAKAMHTRYAGEIRNEGSIKNAISRWRKTERKNV